MWLAPSWCMFFRLSRFSTLLLLSWAAACARPNSAMDLEAELAYPRPEGVPLAAWTQATAAYQHAVLQGVVSRPILTVIDYTVPSTRPRLWVVDLATSRVLLRDYVAHGSGSGGILASAFSNVNGSRRSSVGALVTGARFSGVRGISLRLNGLEPGVNDHAAQRGIIIHGTPGVSAEKARQGRMGRTEGCPAVSRETARRLIPLIEEGTLVYIWYPDPTLLRVSEYLDRNHLVEWNLGTIGG